MENKENIIQETVAKKKFWKFFSMIILLNLGLIAVVAKLFYVQIIDADELSEKAKRQHESRIQLESDRGLIFDRQGRLLVSNIRSYSVAVDPKLFFHKNSRQQKELRKKLRSICDEMARINNTNSSKLYSKLISSKKRFVYLGRGLSAEKIQNLKKMDLKGLILIEEPKRYSIYENIAAQIIGITNIDKVGINGIEKQYDSLLTGQDGFTVMHRDARGILRPGADLPHVAPINGNAINLTIDIDLQRIVEHELETGLEKYNAKSATAIAMNPKTGEILAMASAPGFNPNDLKNATNSQMRIRAINDTYEPGSTFKLITAAAALEEKIVDTTQVFNAFGGKLKFPEYTITDDHPMEELSFNEAMIHSSNIVFAQIAASLPGNIFYKYIRDFGFGLSHDIDLPGEHSGKLDKAKKFNKTKKHFVGHGYGLTTTPLQMLSAYATVANNGDMLKPYLVKEVKNSNGDIIFTQKAETIRNVISEKTCQTLNQMLVNVVEQGTGSNARIDGLSIAGKTGTAQQVENRRYSKQYYTASFAGFFPAENPQIALIVVIDKPMGNYYGGSTAAPIFKNIVLRWMAINPLLDAYIENMNDSQQTIVDSVKVPKLHGLTYAEAKKRMELLGFKLASNKAKNSDVIVSQNPDPGEISLRGNTIHIDVIRKYKDTTTNELVPELDRPDVRGLSLRRASKILLDSGIRIEVVGSGYVIKQYWTVNKAGDVCCKLVCK